jgi:phosphoglycolate phosphatase-like HAD superfamily hydrolase
MRIAIGESGWLTDERKDEMKDRSPEEMLRQVGEGLDIIESALAISLKAEHADAPFPLDEEQARLWHKAHASAYTHALEMLSANSVKEYLEQKPGSPAKVSPKL